MKSRPNIVFRMKKKKETYEASQEMEEFDEEQNGSTNIVYQEKGRNLWDTRLGRILIHGNGQCSRNCCRYRSILSNAGGTGIRAKLKNARTCSGIKHGVDHRSCPILVS